MKQKKHSDVTALLGYAGKYKGLTFLGLTLSAVAMILGMAPYITRCFPASASSRKRARSRRWSVLRDPAKAPAPALRLAFGT